MNVRRVTAICLLWCLPVILWAQEKTIPSMDVAMTNTKAEMKTFLIERNIPSIGNSSLEDLKNASKKSCTVLGEMGEGIEWVTSYVTQDKIFCVYKASDKALIEKHAAISGFPANAIHEVAASFVKPPEE